MTEYEAYQEHICYTHDTFALFPGFSCPFFMWSSFLLMPLQGAGTIKTPELHWHLRRSFDDCYLISAEQTPRKSWAASWAEAYLPNAYCVMQEHHLLTMAGVTSP